MTPNSPQPSYVNALKLLLRPLLRGLISHGVTLPSLSALLKQVYVEAAEDFRIANKKLTDSRVSLLTGVHRKDVRRIRDEERDVLSLSSHASIGVGVVALWTADSRYLADDGTPAPLERTGPGSFDELVENVNRDMRPRTLLDEWLRRSIVHINEEEKIVLNQNAFVPSADYDDLAYYFGRNLHDHIAVSVHNLEGHGKPLLERSTYYEGLRKESVSELEKISREIGMEALVKLNKEAQKLVRKDAKKEGADRRFNFGIYFYRDDMSMPSIEEGTSPKSEKRGK